MLRHVLLHNTALMPPRLTFALALSLALHGGLLLPDILKRPSVAPPPPALQAVLRLPPEPEAIAFDPLLKNTLDDEESPKAVKEMPPRPPPNIQVTKPPSSIKRDTQKVQKKLSEYVWYPAEASSRGIEGTVGLLITFSADGSVEDVQIYSSSGYPILDKAAEKGVWAMLKLPGVKTRELPVSYTFRLVR